MSFTHHKLLHSGLFFSLILEALFVVYLEVLTLVCGLFHPSFILFSHGVWVSSGKPILFSLLLLFWRCLWRECLHIVAQEYGKYFLEHSHNFCLFLLFLLAWSSRLHLTAVFGSLLLAFDWENAPSRSSVLQNTF